MTTPKEIQKLIEFSQSIGEESIAAFIRSDYEPRRTSSEKSAAIVAISIIEASKAIGFPIISLGGVMHIWCSTHYKMVSTRDVERLKENFAIAAGWTVVDTAVTKFIKEFSRVITRQSDPSKVFIEGFSILKGMTFEDGVVIRKSDGKWGFVAGHKPNEISTYCIPDKFKSPKKKNADWQNFITRLIPSEEQRKYVLASLGNSICNDPLNAQKMLILLGAAGAGKTTLIESVCALVGQENVMKVDTLAQLTAEDSRHRMGLAHNTLCVCGDASDRLGNKDVLKQIISKEEITARLLFSEPIKIKPKSSVLIATNEIGFTHALSDGGLSRRMDIIMFDKGLKEKDRDSDLLNKLSSLEAKQVIGRELMLALIYHSELNEYRLVRPEEIEKSLDLLRQDGDAFLSFLAMHGLSTKHTGNKTVTIHQDDLLTQFNQFCSLNNFKTISMRKLKGKCRSFGIEAESCRGNKHRYRLQVDDDDLLRMNGLQVYATYDFN